MLSCFFVFDYNVSYYNTLKMGLLTLKELFVFVLLSFFITLINLGAQTLYTVVNFGLNQPLAVGFICKNEECKLENNI